MQSSPLTIDTINPKLLTAEYAVRGALSRLADQVGSELASGSHAYPFDSIVRANLGNPQGLAQKPISFMRQVQALTHYPPLIDEIAGSEALQKLFPSDVVDRAKLLLKACTSVGAYSSNQGLLRVRESCAQYISDRDGYPADPDNIFLTCGAFEGMLVSMFLFAGGEKRGEKTGVMLSVPQYPVYVALLKMLDLEHVPYHLDENTGWGLSERVSPRDVVRDAKSAGITPRCLVIINPSNPTGALLSREDIQGLICVAASEDLVILADEVYQSNIFLGSEFVSVRKVLCELQVQDSETFGKVQLISLHSVSKGITGEGGQRGGYFETFNFSPEVNMQVKKLVSFMLQPATPGQIVLECMVNPPKLGGPSYELYSKEKSQIESRLEDISKRLYGAFKKMPGVTCQEPKGALYLFPRTDLPEKAVEACVAEGMKKEEVDVWFCMQLLKEAGVCVVPGSGFGKSPVAREDGQPGASVWFRITFLAEGEEWIDAIRKFYESFMAKYK